DWEVVENTIQKQQKWNLENGYSIKVESIDLEGNKAKIALMDNGEIIDSEIVIKGGYYEYHTKIPKIQELYKKKTLSDYITNQLGEYNGEKEEITVVNLTLKEVFRQQDFKVVSLKGIILKRRHRETQSNQCYACHVMDYKYGEGQESEGEYKEGMDFMVLDTEINTDTDAYNVTLSRTPINFSDTEEKTLKENDTWQLGDGYFLKVKNIDLEGKKSNLILGVRVKGSGVRDLPLNEVVKENGIFDYDIKLIKNRPNITIFTATLNKVFRSKEVNLITLKKVKYVSPNTKILTVYNNSDRLYDTREYISQYKIRDLKDDQNITISADPDNFHQVSLNSGHFGGADCLSCHKSKGLPTAPKIEENDFKESVHSKINKKARINTTTNLTLTLTSSVKACWTCHGDWKEPVQHPKNDILEYANPKKCLDCHSNVVKEIKEGYLMENSMTKPRNEIIAPLGEDPDNFGEKVGLYARHANPLESIGKEQDRDPNQVCLNCHSGIIRKFGEYKSEYGNISCRPCHYLWKPDQKNPSPHDITLPKCTDCHSSLTKTVQEPWNIYSVSPMMPNLKVGPNLNFSVHRKMVLNTTTNQITNSKGCLVCHTKVTFEISEDIEILNKSGVHTWIAKPLCLKCHSPPINGKWHQNLTLTPNTNSECLNCHSPANTRGIRGHNITLFKISSKEYNKKEYKTIENNTSTENKDTISEASETPKSSEQYIAYVIVVVLIAFFAILWFLIPRKTQKG
ncbi:MAG: S-layer protein domain-containing protein, partial [Methanosarcinales archaeon]